MEVKRQASKSDAQQEAGRAAILALARRKGIELQPRRLQFGDVAFQLDGYHEDAGRITLVEMYAHIGPVRAAQRHRVMADVLKLALLKRLLGEARPGQQVDCLFVFLDEAATSVVSGKSWAALAAREFGVGIEVISVAPELVARVRAAQVRQDLRNDQ
jgi:hypothetical protein